MPGSTQVSSWLTLSFAYGALTLFGRLSHTFPLDFMNTFAGPYNPTQACLHGLGFSPFARHYSGNDLFSSGYLDVSVPQVPFTILYIQMVIPLVRSGGFPHSEISGYIACLRLPEAYRNNLRPSSALGAKASTINP